MRRASAASDCHARAPALEGGCGSGWPARRAPWRTTPTACGETAAGHPPEHLAARTARDARETRARTGRTCTSSRRILARGRPVSSRTSSTTTPSTLGMWRARPSTRLRVGSGLWGSGQGAEGRSGRRHRGTAPRMINARTHSSVDTNWPFFLSRGLQTAPIGSLPRTSQGDHVERTPLRSLRRVLAGALVAAAALLLPMSGIAGAVGLGACYGGGGSLAYDHGEFWCNGGVYHDQPID